MDFVPNTEALQERIDTLTAEIAVLTLIYNEQQQQQQQSTRVLVRNIPIRMTNSKEQSIAEEG